MGNYLFYIPLFFPIFRYMHFNRNRFQMVLTYNQNQSYLIGSFLELDNDGASVSINNLDAGCFRSLVPPLSSSRLEVESNIGDKGRFIWDLNVCDKEANGDGRSRFPNNQYRVSSTIHKKRLWSIQNKLTSKKFKKSDWFYPFFTLRNHAQTIKISKGTSHIFVKRIVCYYFVSGHFFPTTFQGAEKALYGDDVEEWFPLTIPIPLFKGLQSGFYVNIKTILYYKLQENSTL